jgi:hypothetical protein
MCPVARVQVTEIFDAYLSRIKNNLKIRLLSAHGKTENSLRSAFQKYVAQNGSNTEVHLAENPIHDRVLILDEKSCWLLGQSIKDAAKKSPTYLVPISQDYVDIKICEYEKIWSASASI